MKCPKCGYNSFDHLESCKKCGEDMISHKTRFGLRSLFFGAGKPESNALAEVGEPEAAALPEEADIPAAPADFGFDFMEGEASDDGPFESSDRDDTESDLTREGEFPTWAGEDEASGLDLDWGSEPLDSLPEFSDQDFARAPESPQGEHPEFVFGDGESAAIQGESSGTFEVETAGGDPASTNQLSWDDFDETAGGIAEPSVLPETPSETGLFSWEDASEPEERQEESGSSEANLAELFLKSLDDTADDFESAEAVPPSFAEEDLFGDISAEVDLVEGEKLEFQGSPESASPDFEWEEEGEETPVEVKAPPLTFRIGAGITDLVILAVVFILFLAAGEVALGPGKADGLLPSPATLLELAIPYFLVLFAACFGYFTLFHFLIGQTPGKMLFRIKVVGEEGDGLMFSQAFLRSVGGLLSLLPAGLGYLRIAIDRDRRGWNDRLANSRVVPVAGWDALEDLKEDGVAQESL